MSLWNFSQGVSPQYLGNFSCILLVHQEDTDHELKIDSKVVGKLTKQSMFG